MKTTIEYAEELLSQARLSRKERLYIEKLVKAELKALRSLEKREIQESALSYMESRHEERMAIYERISNEHQKETNENNQ